MRQSQNAKILKHLQSGKSLTAMEALNRFGSFRLSARIFELCRLGYPIEAKLTEMHSGKIVSVYTMKK